MTDISRIQALYLRTELLCFGLLKAVLVSCNMVNTTIILKRLLNRVRKVHNLDRVTITEKQALVIPRIME